MTKTEAAAKCREMAESCRQRALSGPPDSARDAAHEREVAYRLAAGVIDQIIIPMPQPWPPPESVTECMAYNVAEQKWQSRQTLPSNKLLSTWEGVGKHLGPFSHWLPMPPAPEVQG